MTEKQVEAAVEAYFAKHLSPTSYILKRQDKIQFGTNFGKADLVIYRGKPRTKQVIIECKGLNASHKTIEDGIGQLQSYLCATDTRLGIFAASCHPGAWSYFINSGNNAFLKITEWGFIGELRAYDNLLEHREKDISQRLSVKFALV